MKNPFALPTFRSFGLRSLNNILFVILNEVKDPLTSVRFFKIYYGKTGGNSSPSVSSNPNIRFIF